VQYTFLQFQPKIASESTHTLQIAGRTPEREKIETAWRNSIENDLDLRLGAFDGNRIIGQLSFHSESYPAHPWTKHTGQFGMMILQEFWGQGIGRRLLEIMEEHARSHGIERIEAMVRAQNIRGVKLYTRMGYEIEGTRKRGAIIDGTYQDEYYIAKILNTPEWSPPVLETDRLLLRPLGIQDAVHIYEYARNPNVSRFTLWEPHQTITDSESYILDYALPYYRKRTPEPWGITLKSDPKKIIGTVGLFWVSEKAKSMELAYALAESHWGQGLVAEASRAAMDYCLSELGAVRIQARCKTENTASAKVMEKLGMKFEGTLRSAVFHRGRHWDMHYYAILSDDRGPKG
jgi:ribosomal-protein-alanine N-acetyltransferase